MGSAARHADFSEPAVTKPHYDLVFNPIGRLIVMFDRGRAKAVKETLITIAGAGRYQQKNHGINRFDVFVRERVSACKPAGRVS